MKHFIFFILFFAAIKVNAQDVLNDTSAVIIHKDPRIDMLIKKEAAINSSIKKSSGRTMPGYRLLVIHTNSRDEAIAAKTKIYTYFPELKSYLLYQSPFFKVKAGNFQTRDDAKNYQSMMSTIFPKGVFIINDTIEVKPEKDTDSNN